MSHINWVSGINVFIIEVNRELKRIHIDGCQCDETHERLKAKTVGAKRLVYTGLCG